MRNKVLSRATATQCESSNDVCIRAVYNNKPRVTATQCESSNDEDHKPSLPT